MEREDKQAELTTGETAFLAGISLAWIFIVIEIFKLIF
jgi:hypothetical protein